MDRINKPLSFLLLLFLLMNCQEEEPIVDKVEQPAAARYTIAGYVQKGPFINGTTLTIAELDDSLRATGKNFSAQINDNKGSFSLEDIELASSNVQLTANGFYFDEVKGEKSIAQLTLTALTNIDGKDQTNVNLLSHLTKDRILYLIRQGNMFTEAKQQAQQEVLSIFGIIKEDLVSAELLDISKEGEDNAILLAISAILQANNTVAELSELLANIITDIREDGKLNDQAVQKQLVKQSTLLRLPQIRTHLEKRYEELKVNASIANFEKYVDSDGDGILNKDEDDTPDEFVFSMQKDVAISTEITSNEITIAGLKAGGYAAASVQKAKLMLNGSVLTDTLAKVKNGDKIKLLLTSSSQYADTVVASLTVGYLTSYFTVVTDDYKPDSFSFTAQKDVAVDSFYTSNTITVSGLPYLTPATIENGVLIKNGVEQQADTTSVKNGDTLAIKLRSSEQYFSKASAKLNINDTFAAFEITTDDYMPDDFNFIPIENAKRDSIYTSNNITFSGLLHPTPISVEQGILLINGQEVNNQNITVHNEDIITVNVKTQNLFSAKSTVRVQVGATVKTFNVITEKDPWKVIDRNFPFVHNDNRDNEMIWINNRLYILHYDGQFYEYNTTTKELTQKANCPEKRYIMGRKLFSIDNKLYAGFGYYEPNGEMGYNVNEFWMYDPNTNNWKELSSFPEEQTGTYTNFIIKDKAYISFLSNVHTGIQFWEYDSRNDSWNQIADYPGTFSYDLISFVMGEKGYVSTPTKQDILETWEYDPKEKIWRKRTSYPFESYGCQAFTLHGKGYILNSNSFSFYDQEDDKWLESSYLPLNYKVIEAKDHVYFWRGRELVEFTPPQE